MRDRAMTLNINLSSRGNTFFVQGTSALTTNLNLGTGANAIGIGTQAHATFDPAADLIAKVDPNGNLIAGAGMATNTGSILDNLLGNLNITGSGTDPLNIDDTGSPQGKHMVMDATSIAFDRLGTITFSGFNFLVVSLGQGADQVQVQDTFGAPDKIVSLFTNSDFYQNVNQLVQDFTTQTGASGVSNLLWNLFGQLAPAAQATLGSASATLAQKQQALVDALNAVLQSGHSIYNATAFNGIQLSQATLTLMGQTNPDLVRLNRLLIEDAYAGIIPRSLPTPVIYINGDGGNDIFAVFDIHAATQINGGDGNDIFYIFGNTSTLTLNGDDGDDDFYIFASIQSKQGDASVDGGSGGGAVFNYRSNGHVDVDGGSGFNRLFVYGTILDDTITIDGNSITGAGLDIAFKNVSELDIAGLQGSDTFLIKSIITTTRILGDANLPNFPSWIRIPPHYFAGRPVPVVSLPGSGTTGTVQASLNGVLAHDLTYTITVL